MKVFTLIFFLTLNTFEIFAFLFHNAIDFSSNPIFFIEKISLGCGLTDAGLIDLNSNVFHRIMSILKKLVNCSKLRPQFQARFVYGS